MEGMDFDISVFEAQRYAEEMADLDAMMYGADGYED